MNEGLSAPSAPQNTNEHTAGMPKTAETPVVSRPPASQPSREEKEGALNTRIFSIRNRMSDEEQRYIALRKELELGKDDGIPSHQEDKKKLEELENEKAGLGQEHSSDTETAEDKAFQPEQEAEAVGQKENPEKTERAKNTQERKEKLGETIEKLQKNSTILFGILVTLQAQGLPSPIGLMDQASLVMIPMQMDFLNKAGMLTLDEAERMIAGFKEVIEGRIKPAPSSENGENGSETAAMLAERQFGALEGNVKTIEEMLNGKNEKGETTHDPAELFKPEEKQQENPIISPMQEEKNENTVQPAPEIQAEPAPTQDPQGVPHTQN